MPVWMKPFGARGLSAGTAGEFSLALAHRDVYDTILRERLACALVFENDVLLAPGFVRRLGRLALPDALDVLKLETCNLAAPFRMTRLQAEAVRANETVTVESGEGGWCSAAYLVTHAGAKLLRAAQTPVWLAADELFKYYTASHNMMLSGSHAATLLARGDTSVKHNADTGSDSVSRTISIWHTRPRLAWQVTLTLPLPLPLALTLPLPLALALTLTLTWQDADLKTAGSDKIPTTQIPNQIPTPIPTPILTPSAGAEAQQRKGTGVITREHTAAQQRKGAEAQRLAALRPPAPHTQAPVALRQRHKRSQGADRQTDNLVDRHTAAAKTLAKPSAKDKVGSKKP